MCLRATCKNQQSHQQPQAEYQSGNARAVDFGRTTKTIAEFAGEPSVKPSEVTSIEEFMKRMHLDFEAGRISDCLNYFAMPCTILDRVSGNVDIIRTNLEFNEMLTGYFQAMFDSKVTDRRVNVESVDGLQHGRARAVVKVVEFNDQGVHVATSRIQYTLSPLKRTYIVDMVELLEPPPRSEVTGNTPH